MFCVGNFVGGEKKKQSKIKKQENISTLCLLLRYHHGNATQYQHDTDPGSPRKQPGNASMKQLV